MDARLAGWRSFVKCLRIEIFESRACSVTRATFDRLIAFSCVDSVLLFLAFLIDDRKRTSIEGYQLYCDLMKFTVFRAGCPCIGAAVLLAEETGDLVENFGTFPVAL